MPGLTPTWPSTLPGAPLATTLNITPEPNTAEFKPDVGEALSRLRYPASRTIYSGTLLLEGIQIKALLDFFRDDCGQGTLSFDMTDWLEMAWGGPPATRKFKFDQPPKLDHLKGRNWNAAIVISKID